MMLYCDEDGQVITREPVRLPPSSESLEREIADLRKSLAAAWRESFKIHCDRCYRDPKNCMMSVVKQQMAEYLKKEDGK